MNKSSRILSLLVVASLALLVLGAAYAATKHKTAPKAQQSTSASSVAEQLQQEYEGVVNTVEPSVVQIQTSEGLGSGIVFDAKGDIVTNNHVVGTAKTFKVTLASGKQVNGTLVGTFAADDLAVIHVDAPGLKPARFADSSRLQVGQIALAVGNPLGFRSSVTDGIVSALGRTVSEPGGATLPNVIQTSAAINPGNSGGALVDLHGAVIGIPTLGVSDPQMGGAASGIGFAIPSSTVSDIASQLVSKGKVTNSHRAYLGVRVGDTTGGKGALVGSVTAGGPAAAAGIVAGETIVSVDGQKTATTSDLGDLLAGLKPGQKVSIELVRQNGTNVTVSATLGEYPG
ncbi:MAG: S1C family serine protease [Gaiellaceae bacterium]